LAKEETEGKRDKILQGMLSRYMADFKRPVGGVFQNGLPAAAE
jgi:hypothetical protein